MTSSPLYYNRRNNNVSPVVVGHPIEIYNRFIQDFDGVVQIAKQCKATPCHKPSFSKEGLGGL